MVQLTKNSSKSESMIQQWGIEKPAHVSEPLSFSDFKMKLGKKVSKVKKKKVNCRLKFEKTQDLTTALENMLSTRVQHFTLEDIMDIAKTDELKNPKRAIKNNLITSILNDLDVTDVM
ncbi:hypothetical protein RF11_14765 [Thelohanellus kitauei]|uniref:Uncharacterized protein n=1 Tax=Thelohanellus kitauei TaxID=669202 RepID=A0A0C2N3P5_THEKT|nr:hypothetical protein RF11_14765 [Thelohanellus kitauei]